MQTVSYRTAIRKLIEAGDRIMSATYVKENGEKRHITFRRNVASQIKNNPDNAKNDSRKRIKRGSLITVVEMDGENERKWKTINLRTLRILVVDKESYLVNEPVGIK